MTQSQLNAKRCGMVPEDNPPDFFAKHLSAYHFLEEREFHEKRAGQYTLDKSILEVGFGDGYGMSYLSKSAKEVLGLDIAPQNIPIARAKYPNPKLSFIHFDGYYFPFENDRFDIICAFQVIEHIPEQKLIDWLTEIKRVLKPGGKFYASTLNLKNAQKPGTTYQKNVDHEKEFYAYELQSLLHQVFEHTEYFGLFYSFKYRVFRRLKKWGLGMLGFVRKFFLSVTVNDFVVKSNPLDNSIDLFAVCYKSL